MKKIETKTFVSLILLAISIILAVLIAMPHNVTTVIIPKTMALQNNVSLLLKFIVFPAVMCLFSIVIKILMYRKDSVTTPIAHALGAAPVILAAIASSTNALLYTFMADKFAASIRYLVIAGLVLLVAILAIFLVDLHKCNKSMKKAGLIWFDIFLTIFAAAIVYGSSLLVKYQIESELIITNNDYIMFGTLFIIIAGVIYFYSTYTLAFVNTTYSKVNNQETINYVNDELTRREEKARIDILHAMYEYSKYALGDENPEVQIVERTVEVEKEVVVEKPVERVVFVPKKDSEKEQIIANLEKEVAELKANK